MSEEAECSEELRKANIRIDELETALVPFAAYMDAMNNYARIHRGAHLSDSKVLAYSATELGTSAALVVGHFRDALHVMGEVRLPQWDGMYRSPIRPVAAAKVQA